MRVVENQWPGPSLSKGGQAIRIVTCRISTYARIGPNEPEMCMIANNSRCIRKRLDVLSSTCRDNHFSLCPTLCNFDESDQGTYVSPYSVDEVRSQSRLPRATGQRSVDKRDTAAAVPNMISGQSPRRPKRLHVCRSMLSYTVVHHSYHPIVVAASRSHHCSINGRNPHPYELPMLSADEQAALYPHLQQGRTTSWTSTFPRNPRRRLSRSIV
jgi:hypothetical protein